MGDEEPRTGVWERVYSGNPLTKEKKGTIWGNGRKYFYGCKREFPPAMFKQIFN